mmetsp:Transcript_3457/g.8128  ORF Transcript_3457/g.8128 Transcript_3457/m.8128 type:complete len:357 (+) Transcript_3457:740-1810(+)
MIPVRQADHFQRVAGVQLHPLSALIPTSSPLNIQPVKQLPLVLFPVLAVLEVRFYHHVPQQIQRTVPRPGGDFVGVLIFEKVRGFAIRRAHGGERVSARDASARRVGEHQQQTSVDQLPELGPERWVGSLPVRNVPRELRRVAAAKLNGRAVVKCGAQVPRILHAVVIRLLRLPQADLAHGRESKRVGGGTGPVKRRMVVAVGLVRSNVDQAVLVALLRKEPGFAPVLPHLAEHILESSADVVGEVTRIRGGRDQDLPLTLGGNVGCAGDTAHFRGPLDEQASLSGAEMRFVHPPRMLFRHYHVRLGDGAVVLFHTTLGDIAFFFDPARTRRVSSNGRRIRRRPKSPLARRVPLRN